MTPTLTPEQCRALLHWMTEASFPEYRDRTGAVILQSRVKVVLQRIARQKSMRPIIPAPEELKAKMKRLSERPPVSAEQARQQTEAALIARQKSKGKAKR